MPGTVLVIPCFDEARRLDRAEFLRLAAEGGGLELLFVDDGSRDGTAGVVAELHRATAAIRLLALPENVGKGEAVRAGLRAALLGGADVVGYADADLATPVDELARLARRAAEGDAEAVLGARLRTPGARIERGPVRYLLGRLFAAVASLALRTRVRDTQCGAKFFRRSPALEAALATPFRSRWAFDVELLGRLLEGARGVPPIRPEALVEVPLLAWRDSPGSRLRFRWMVRTGLELLAIVLRSRTP